MNSLGYNDLRLECLFSTKNGKILFYMITTSCLDVIMLNIEFDRPYKQGICLLFDGFERQNSCYNNR